MRLAKAVAAGEHTRQAVSNYSSLGGLVRLITTDDGVVASFPVSNYSSLGGLVRPGFRPARVLWFRVSNYSSLGGLVRPLL